jgi:hypothetical protein
LKDWKEIEQKKSWYLNWLDKEKSCICSLFTGYRIFTHKYTYSWSRILRGKLRKGPRENLVLDKISIALAFLFFSSPSFPPEARWLHTKQKLVSCKQNLTETDPCIYKPYWSSTSTHTDLFALIFFLITWVCVCVCMYVYICMYIYMYVCMYVRTYLIS